MLYRNEDGEVEVYISMGGAMSQAEYLSLLHQCETKVVQFKERGELKGYAVQWYPKKPTMH